MTSTSYFVWAFSRCYDFDDVDGDGKNNIDDALPFDGSETLDTDGDGIGDSKDVFPTNANESVDTDGDGIEATPIRMMMVTVYQIVRIRFHWISQNHSTPTVRRSR